MQAGPYMPELLKAMQYLACHPLLATTSALLATLLDRWTGIGAKRAVHTAIALERLEHRVALGAFVKPLAGIGGHGLGFGKPALRACQRGLQRDGAQFADFTTVDG